MQGENNLTSEFDEANPRRTAADMNDNGGNVGLVNRDIAGSASKKESSNNLTASLNKGEGSRVDEEIIDFEGVTNPTVNKHTGNEMLLGELADLGYSTDKTADVFPQH